MATLFLGDVHDRVVLHFGGESSRINVYTLASAIVGLADAARVVNAAVNPGYQIELVVEAFDEGSFKSTIRAILHEGRNLFSAESARNIALGIVASIIYDQAFSTPDIVIVNVSPSEVVIQSDGDRVVVPRVLYDFSQQLRDRPNVRAGIERAVLAVITDSAVDSFAISGGSRGTQPIPIPRERLELVAKGAAVSDGDSRVFDEIVELQILRAILQRSRRKWEFVWNGQKISAPVLDSGFFDDFFARRVTIAPGDALKVRLRVRQKRHPDIRVFITESYEVVEVLEHRTASSQQADFDLRP